MVGRTDQGYSINPYSHVVYVGLTKAKYKSVLSCGIRRTDQGYNINPYSHVVYVGLTKAKYKSVLSCGRKD